MKTPIDIEIPMSLPQHPWHPSVVYVQEGWNGHMCWMAQTPYPPFHVAPYKDRWELPCILYSNDGVRWKSIETNPIDNLTEEQIASHSYHSDPHLVMKEGVLYCYYRLMENHDARTTIIRKKSRDGVKWSEREIITLEETKTEKNTVPAINTNKEDEVIKNAESLDTCSILNSIDHQFAREQAPGQPNAQSYTIDSVAQTLSNDSFRKNVDCINCEKSEKNNHAGSREIISPAVVWTGEKWRMYYVDDTYTNLQRGMQMAESEDGIHFKVIGSVWDQQEVKPWHIDVQLIEGVYYMLVHDVDDNSLWLYTSKEGMHFGEGKEILRASGKLTDYWSHKLYRACLVNVEGKNHIYFSANDGMASYIGLIVEEEQGKYTIVDCMHGSRKAEFVVLYWSRRIMQFKQRVIHFIEKRIK